MKTWKLSTSNWHLSLANAINKSQDGDIIIVKNLNQQSLALRAHNRICPNKELSIQIEECKEVQ